MSLGTPAGGLAGRFGMMAALECRLAVAVNIMEQKTFK